MLDVVSTQRPRPQPFARLSDDPSLALVEAFVALIRADGALLLAPLIDSAVPSVAVHVVHYHVNVVPSVTL